MNRGFSLIEIIVAVTIVSLLSTMGVTGFQAVTRSGRDALRKSDLEQIRSALEIFKSQNGYYPDADPGSTNSCDAALTTDYINKYPQDPKSPAARYCYVKISNLTYQLCAHIENGDNSDYCTGMGGSELCGDGVGCNYQVTNP